MAGWGGLGDFKACFRRFKIYSLRPYLVRDVRREFS